MTRAQVLVRPINQIVLSGLSPGPYWSQAAPQPHRSHRLGSVRRVIRKLCRDLAIQSQVAVMPLSPRTGSLGFSLTLDRKTNCPQRKIHQVALVQRNQEKKVSKHLGRLPLPLTPRTGKMGSSTAA